MCILKNKIDDFKVISKQEEVHAMVFTETCLYTEAIKYSLYTHEYSNVVNIEGEVE